MVREQVRPTENTELAPEPSGPNNVPEAAHQSRRFPRPLPRRTRNQYSQTTTTARRQVIDDPPVSNPHNTFGRGGLPGHPNRGASAP